MTATWDPNVTGGWSLSNGNMTATSPADTRGAIIVCQGLQAIPRGKKIYWEVACTNGRTYTAYGTGFGVKPSPGVSTKTSLPNTLLYHDFNYNGGVAASGFVQYVPAGSPPPSIWTNTPEYIGIVADFTTNQVGYIYRGSLYQGTMFSMANLSSSPVYPLLSSWTANGNPFGNPARIGTINDGASAFHWTMPSGYTSLFSALNGGGGTGTSPVNPSITVAVAGPPATFVIGAQTFSGTIAGGVPSSIYGLWQGHQPGSDVTADGVVQGVIASSGKTFTLTLTIDDAGTAESLWTTHDHGESWQVMFSGTPGSGSPPPPPPTGGGTTPPITINQAPTVFAGNIYNTKGVPIRGIGSQLAYANNTPSSVPPIWKFTIQYFNTPRSMLIYGGDFNLQSNYVGYLTTNARDCAAEPYLNGTLTGKRFIPIIGIPLVVWGRSTGQNVVAVNTSDCTYTTVMAGQNDVNIAQLVTSWTKQGFMELCFRLGYEDNYPTTPDGWGASHADQNAPLNSYTLMSDPAMVTAFAGTSQGNPSAAAVNLFCKMHSQLFRRFAYLIHKTAAAQSATAICSWGVTLINNCSFDPRRMDPDLPAFQALDSYGPQVDMHQPDFYMGWSQWTLAWSHYFTGYDKQKPFTQFAATGNTPGQSYSTSNGNPCLINGNWQNDPGSEYWCYDYYGSYKSAWATTNLATTPLQWSGGWGVYESMVYALQQGKMWGSAEFAATSTWDGTQGGAKYGPGPTLPGQAQRQSSSNFPELGPYIQSRVSWFQDKAQNGLAWGLCYQISMWQNQGIGTLQSLAKAYPSLVANPDVGGIVTGKSGTGVQTGTGGSTTTGGTSTTTGGTTTTGGDGSTTTTGGTTTTTGGTTTTTGTGGTTTTTGGTTTTTGGTTTTTSGGQTTTTGGTTTTVNVGGTTTTVTSPYQTPTVLNDVTRGFLRVRNDFGNSPWAYDYTSAPSNASGLSSGSGGGATSSAQTVVVTSLAQSGQTPPNVLSGGSFTVVLTSQGTGFSNVNNIWITFALATQGTFVQANTISGVTVVLSTTTLTNDTATISGLTVTAQGSQSFATAPVSLNFWAQDTNLGAAIPVTVTSSAFQYSVIPPATLTMTVSVPTGLVAQTPFVATVTFNYQPPALSQMQYTNTNDGSTNYIPVSSAQGGGPTIIGNVMQLPLNNFAASTTWVLTIEDTLNGITSIPLTYTVVAIAALPIITVNPVPTQTTTVPFVATANFNYVPTLSNLQYDLADGAPPFTNWAAVTGTLVTTGANTVLSQPETVGLAQQHCWVVRDTSNGVQSNAVFFGVNVAPTQKTITVSVPGGLVTGTPYNATVKFSYTPPSLANLQYTNTLTTDQNFVLVSTSPGGTPKIVGNTMTLPLLNYAASPNKNLQVKDTSNTVLSNNLVYPVNTP